MSHIKACIACLNTPSKLFGIDGGTLRGDYNLVSGLETYKGDGMPEHLCFECRNSVEKFKTFRNKCQRSNNALQEIVNTNRQLQLTHLRKLCRSISGGPNLNYFTTSKVCYEVAILEDSCARYEPKITEKWGVPILHVNTFDSGGKKYSELSPKVSQVKEETDDTKYDIENPVVYVDGNKCDFYDESTSYAYLDEDEDSTLAKVQKDCEYATLVSISHNEASAAYCILQDDLKDKGKFRCQSCVKWFCTQAQLRHHQRVHNKSHGNVVCKICKYHYKTDQKLEKHMKEKHNYKYLCTKCNEVNFDRTSAKQHYTREHTKPLIAEELKLNSKPKRPKKVVSRKNKKNVHPTDYLKHYVQTPKEQYQMIEERKNSRNYLTSPFKCELCYKGFRVEGTYESHMKVHDPTISGKYQCDVCKVRTKKLRQLAKHITHVHLYKYVCQMCQYQCSSSSQANEHYRFHKNIKYDCPHCDLVFDKRSTHMTHIRLKHPSTVLCNICGHSFVTRVGLNFHMKKIHTAQELSECVSVEVDKSSALYCAACDVQLLSQDAYDTHLHTSSKHCTVNLSNHKRQAGQAALRGYNSKESGTSCHICGEYLKNDYRIQKHYRECHRGVAPYKRYICDVCAYATAVHDRLVVHQRSHSREQPYACPHCARRFTMPGNRDRHILVHTGEKPFECEHCHRRFSQKTTLKLHIQTVHMKIPYAPWNKKNRRRKKDLESPLPFSEPRAKVEKLSDHLAKLPYKQPYLTTKEFQKAYSMYPE